MLRGGIDEKAEIVQPMSRLGLTRMVGKVLRKQRSKMTGQDGQQGRRFIDEPDNRCAIPKINRQCITPPGTGIDRHQVGKTITRLEGKISMTLMLNDAFEGGEICFRSSEEEISRKLQVGEVVLFSSFLSHRVKPVTKGTRHVVVAWFTGPPFR